VNQQNNRKIELHLLKVRSDLDIMKIPLPMTVNSTTLKIKPMTSYKR